MVARALLHLEHHELVIASKVSCDRRPGNAAADDNDIRHVRQVHAPQLRSRTFTQFSWQSLRITSSLKPRLRKASRRPPSPDTSPISCGTTAPSKSEPRP